MTKADQEGFAAFLLRMRARGINDAALFAAIEAAGRRDFVPGPWQDAVWLNRTLPIPCGEAIEGIGSSARALKGLGYVPQSRDVFPTLTVEENLFVGLKGRPRTAIEEAYQMFPRLKERRRNLGSQLSGGEQQMLTTARTILGQPSVLLLDEPLEGLAPVICEELMAAFGTLAASGEMTILLVEQRIQSALDFADDVIILERGRIAWTGTPAALSADRHAVETLLGVGGLH